MHSRSDKKITETKGSASGVRADKKTADIAGKKAEIKQAGKKADRAAWKKKISVGAHKNRKTVSTGTDLMESRKRREASRIRRKKQVRLLKVMLAAIIILLVIVFILLLSGKNRQSTSEIPEAYSAKEYTDPSLSAFSLQTEKSFAADLIVTDGDDNPQGITLQGENVRGLLFDKENMDVLFAQNVYDRIYPASITKIMTAIVTLENASMDEVVTMESDDFALEEDAQTSGLSAGDQLTMDQLFHMLLVYSANDAAKAIARTVGGSEEQFVEMMNEKAAALGMTGTHFVNPTGLHDDNHYTTAYDVYLMMNEACKHPEFLQISQLPQYEVNCTSGDGEEKSFMLYATDEFLTGQSSLPEGLQILASKTGTTSQAGACLALLVQDDYGRQYLAVIMNDLSHTMLYTDMATLLGSISAQEGDTQSSRADTQENTAASAEKSSSSVSEKTQE